MYDYSKYIGFATEERIEKVTKLLSKRKDDITIVFENILDPHNIAACLRTCDAAGILEVHIVYSPNYKRLINRLKTEGLGSSATAKKWVNVYAYSDIQQCYSILKNQGFTILTSKLNETSKSLYDIDFATNKIALVFGNEKNGLSDKAYSLADGNFNIPQIGIVESLNISVACSVSLYESFRQKSKLNLYDNFTISKENYYKTMDRVILEKSKLDIKFIDKV